jgi:hypothetical protein
MGSQMRRMRKVVNNTVVLLVLFERVFGDPWLLDGLDSRLRGNDAIG